MSADFPWLPVLPLLSSNGVLCRGILGFEVATEGSGPYDEGDFDEFLIDCGIEVRAVELSERMPDTIILGRDDWDPDAIDEVRGASSSESLRVFSQEMVVASLAAGVDLFKRLGGRIDDFIDGHPGLEYFYLGGDEPAQAPVVRFPDVPLQVAEGSKSLVVNLDSSEWPTQGVLGVMGYRVGKSGRGVSARHRILMEAVRVNLTPGSANALGYVTEWGAPNSQQRLQKIVDSIAAFARTAKRRKTFDMSQAISDWESDLEWLRAAFK